MGMGPTATVGFLDEDGKWTPVSATNSLPTTGGGGGGGGAVDSVNGQTGAVVLTGADIEVSVNSTTTDTEDALNQIFSTLQDLAPGLAGGSDGQVLTKQSATNADYAWEALPEF